MSSNFLSNLSNLDRKQKIVGGVAAAVLLICVFMTVRFLVSFIEVRGPAKPPDTPATRTATDLSTKILALNQKFADVQALVERESPLAIRIEGEVHSEKDLQELKAFIQENLPDAEVVWAVPVVPKR